MARLPLRLLPCLLLLACATPPAPGPQGDDQCVVAISVRTSDSDSRWGRPETVYFVRLVDSADPAQAGPVLKSEYHYGNVVCLLNAQAGRYVAVGCSERRNGHDWTTYFSEAFLRATEVTVEPGGFAYMGSFDHDILRATAKPEPAQVHYERLISPKWLAASSATKLFTRYRYAYGRAFRPTGTAAEDEARIREHLAASGWAARPD